MHRPIIINFIFPIVSILLLYAVFFQDFGDYGFQHATKIFRKYYP